MTLLDTALALRDAGCSVIPVSNDGSKMPAVAWKAYQQAAADAAQLSRWFRNGSYDGLGVICGAASHHLEMLEVEGRALHLVEQLAQLMRDNGFADLWARLSAGYLEQSPSGGMHWLYRVDGDIRGNTKLARRPGPPDPDTGRPTINVLIETRGEGGYTVVAPSAGRSHPTGRAWTRLAGCPESIPTLSTDERDALHAIAAMLDEMPAEQPAERTTPDLVNTAGLRPGDDYNARAAWEDILTPHGWQRTKTFATGGYGWTRAGKNKREGISATTGTSKDGADRLYVFSSSTEFDTERPYSKFAAYALLEHRGDHSKAASALRSAGYGAPPPEKRPLTMVTGDAQPTIEGTAALEIDQQGSQLPARVDITLTDNGNAQLFVSRHSNHLRYVPSRGRWLRWDGCRWDWCEDDSEAIEAAVDTIGAIKPTDTEQRKHKHRSQSRRALEATAALARRDPVIRVKARDLDADPEALCTPAGVVNLRTGELTPAQPEQLNTRITLTPATAGPTPRWTDFLNDTFGKDQEMIDFVQRLAGYSATGRVGENVLPFLHGSGKNGKTVFLEVVSDLLSDYATSAPAGFLMAGHERHETEIARLDGARMVVCSEVNQSDKFDEAKIKLLTGGDKLTARFMAQNHFTFRPTHKLWLMGNHQPRVNSGGDSFWRRLRLLPFTHVVAPEDRVVDLAKTLVATEGPAILHWIVTGAIHALADGLNAPPSVLAATQTYAAEEDALARFMSDRCHVGGGDPARVNTAQMRHAYTTWCTDEGEKPISPQAFGRELRNRFNVTTVRSNGKRYYTNVTLLADQDEPDDEPDREWYR